MVKGTSSLIRLHDTKAKFMMSGSPKDLEKVKEGRVDVDKAPHLSQSEAPGR